MFVRSGYVNHFYESTRYIGVNGYNWSVTASPVYGTGVIGIASYNLLFGANGADLSGGPDNRWFAYPIRCLAY